MTKAVLLVHHGTVAALDELPAFLARIRRGHAPPPELVEEVRRRYAAIGGASPLHGIAEEVARALAARLSVPVRACGRLAAPWPKDALAALARDLGEPAEMGVAVVPLAQHSAHVYAAAVDAAARELGRPGLRLAAAGNWGRTPALVCAYADAVRAALAAIPGDERAATALVLSAHSLPVAVARAGDAYEAEVRAAAELVVAELGAEAPPHLVCFQSQGMGGGEWLGPDLAQTLDAAKARGARRVVVAPIGFLADHVEILYDLDVEARAWADARGLALTRTASLNASPALVDALAAVARPVLAGLDAGARP